MTEHDDVMDALRRARPDDLPDGVVSAHAPAAQALLEEILSMQTIQTPDARPTETADGTVAPSPTGHRWRQWALVGGAVAAAAVTVVVTSSVVLDPVDPSAATAMEEALALSADSLREAGRADEHYDARFLTADGSPFVESTSSTWEYSGDDSQVFAHPADGAVASAGHPYAINRFVDGELYLYVPDHDGSYGWFRDVGGAEGDPGQFGIDPATLLDQLQPAGDFEEVGTETIDGVATRRLRALNPDHAPALREVEDRVVEVTKLEVWVDDDDLVRRVDFTYVGGDVAPPDAREDDVTELAMTDATVSFRFYDFGEPITIDAPTDFVDIDPVG